MKQQIKNFFSFSASRFFYLVLGVSLGAGIYVAHAVSSGETLTAAAWNALEGKVNAVDTLVEYNASYDFHNGAVPDINDTNIGSHTFCVLSGHKTTENYGIGCGGCFVFKGNGSWVLRVERCPGVIQGGVHCRASCY